MFYLIIKKNKGEVGIKDLRSPASRILKLTMARGSTA
jgi:hypothetical protein